MCKHCNLVHFCSDRCRSVCWEETEDNIFTFLYSIELSTIPREVSQYPEKICPSLVIFVDKLSREEISPGTVLFREGSLQL